MSSNIALPFVFRVARRRGRSEDERQKGRKRGKVGNAQTADHFFFKPRWNVTRRENIFQKRYKSSRGKWEGVGEQAK